MHTEKPVFMYDALTCLFERPIYVFETCQYVFVREPPLATQQQNPQRTMSLATKTGGPAAGIAASLRKELQSLDPDSALYNPRTLDDALAQRAGRDTRHDPAPYAGPHHPPHAHWSGVRSTPLPPLPCALPSSAKIGAWPSS
jgi:hypothetical protein